PVKQGVFTLVVKESTGVLTDPVRMTLLNLLRLANGEPTKLAGHFPVLGLRPAVKDQPGTTRGQVQHSPGAFHSILLLGKISGLHPLPAQSADSAGCWRCQSVAVW